MKWCVKQSPGIKAYRRLFGVVALSFFASACGGGGGSDSSDTSAAQKQILVNAGADVQAPEQSTITVSAKTQDAEQTLTYQWSASPTLEIIQEDESSGEATVTLPVLKEQATYTLTVRVTAENGGTGSEDRKSVV